MNKSKTCLAKIIILCRNPERTSSLYCQTLGLRTHLQSPQLIQLRDSNNLRIYLKSTSIPFQLNKGYSPILSFRVEHFDQVREKMLRYRLIQDGQVLETSKGKLANFLGPQGQHISINNFDEEQEEQEDEDQIKKAEEQEKSVKQMRNLLSKIKL